MNSLIKSCLLLSILFTMPIVAADAKPDKKQEDTTASAANTAEALRDLKCPKCQNPMEQGFLLENQGYSANQTDTKWVQGPVKKRHLPFTDIETKVQRKVEAYRCTNCSYLELYAK